MDEKYIEYLYNSLGGADKFGAYDMFKQGISTDDAFRKDFYNQVGEGVLGNYQEFEGGVKKNDGSIGSGSGDATTSTSQALTGVLGSKEKGPANFTQPLTPAAHLNRRQQAEFARQGGYIMAPEKSKELAATLYEKPVSEPERDMDRLIDIVGDDFQKKQDSQRWLADQVVKIQSGVFNPDQAAQQSAAYAQKAITEGGFGNAQQFVEDAVQNNDYLTLRQVVNNYYGAEQANVKREAVGPGALQGQEAARAERSRTTPNFNDLTDAQVHQQYATLKEQDYRNVIDAEQKLAPIKQEQNRTNQLLDRLSSRLYSLSNPDVQEAFDNDVVGSKPLKDEISINQYSGLRYFKDNNPQLYSQLSMELAKAADPQLFGNEAYDKNNAEYKYLNYILDKKGSELNAMAIDQQLQQAAPAKAQADGQFRQQLGSLQQAMNNATTYEQRKAIADQIQLVQSQYELNPAYQNIKGLLEDAKQADVNFNEKYPDYASRTREQMAKELLQNDGLSWWGEISNRLGWLFNNTVTGTANMSGLNELEFGSSRNYLRNIRKGEQQEFETFQPSENAAVQSLYRLNLNAKDYDVINDIRNSELSRDEQLKAAGDYLDANRSRIGYIENPQAGKRNWTLGAFGNQVADVGTQVIYQGALTYLTAGAARAVLVPEAAAAIETGALAEAGTAVTAESIFGPAAGASADIGGSIASLKSRLINLGSVFGSTYATTYQPAYQSALAAGKSVEDAENYAQQISIVNGLTETISPDIEVLKRATGGVRGLAQAVSPSTLTLAQRFSRGATAFGRGYVRNVVPETLEEVAAAYGEYGVDALYNMNQDEMNSLNNRIKNATITTVIGMTPMGAFSGASSVRNQSRMVREQFYQAGLYPDIIRSEINSMLDNDQISQEEANRRISMVNTMTNIIKDIPPRRDGTPMSDNNKVDYAFSRLKSSIAVNQQETTSDPNAQTDLQAQIDQEQAAQAAILDVVEEPLPTEGVVTVPEETGNTEIAPAVPAYYAGDTLVNNLGNFDILSVGDGTYNVRLPDGQTEDFTEAEINDLIKPTRIEREAANMPQEEQPAAEQIQEISTTTPENTGNAPEISLSEQEISPAAVEEPAVTTVAPQDQNAPVAVAAVEEVQPAAGEVVAEVAGPVVGDTVPAVDAGPVLVDNTISSPTNTETNATDQIIQQESVQQEREPGNESGETAETGGSNRLQYTETGAEEAPLNENAGLSIAEQDAIGEMSKEQLYNNILDIDPDSPVRGRLPAYSPEELQAIYKASLSDYSRGLQEPTPEQTSAAAEPNWATPAPMREVTRSYNQAREDAAKAKQARDQVSNKKSTEYQDRNKEYERAASLSIEAENNYLEGLKKQNQAIRALQNRALGISPEGNAKANARVIANYIEMAKIYARKGVRTLSDFANELGEQINDYMRRAWEITGGNEAPTQNEGESYRDYLKRLREWETGQLAASQTSPERTAIRQLTAELRTGAKNLLNGIKLMDQDINITRESFNEQLGLPANDFLTYVAALKETIANNRDQRRSGREILDSLREAHPNQVIASEMDILRMRLAAEQRGSREGYKQGRRERSAEARTEERNRLKDNIKKVRTEVQNVLDSMFDSKLLDSGTFNQNDLQELSNIINNITTEKQINNLKNLFQRLVTNSSEAQTLESITKLQKKLGKVIKNKESITANMQRKGGYVGNKTILRALKNLNAMKVTQPLRYNAILENVVNSLAGTATLEYSNEQINDFINSQLGAQRANDAADLKTRYGQTLNIIQSIEPNYNPDQVLTQDEFNARVDQISADPNLSEEQRIAELGNLYTAVVAFENEVETPGNIDPATGDVEAQLGDIFEQVRTGTPGKVNNGIRDLLADMISDDQLILSYGVNFPVTDEQALWVRQISQLDPTRLQPKQLALLKNVIDNILTNQDFSAAQYFSAVFESQERVNNFQGWTAEQTQDFKKDSFGKDGLISSMIAEYGETISSSDQIVLTMANNSRDYATRLMDVTALGDIKAAHAQSQQVIDREISRPLAELRKKHKDLRTAESTYKRGMYAYLNENNYGTPADQQREFDRRKRLVEQDIQIKEQLGREGDAKVGEEAAVLRKIFDEHFAGINSQPQLGTSNILNVGEQAVYDLFRNFYDSHKENFREVMESLLNQPFHEVNNYVKDSYRILETGLTDADFRDIDQSNFYTERDQAAPSTATMQRNTFDDLDNIAIRDMEGNVTSRRAINYNFDLAQLNNARGMVEDIHSLKARIIAKMALNDPALRETVGLANSRRLASTVKQQVQQSLGLFAHQDQGKAGEWAGKVASGLNKIGVHMTLFSFGQIPKQQVDIITNTAVNLGTDARLYFDAWGAYGWNGNEEINGLLNQSEIGVRGKTMAGTNWMTPTALSQLQALMGKMGVDAEIAEAPWLARMTIEGADTHGAKVAWLAYYMQSLKRQGLIDAAKNVDWAKENKNINKEARDYAQLMTSSRLNVNSRESQSQFYSKFAGFGRLFQVIFLPLSSFNMNNYATMFRDVNTLFTADTQEQRNTAMRSITSRAMAELAFQVVRGGISLLIKEGVRAALTAAGVEPPKRNTDGFWKKIFSESVKNMMFGMLGNWSVDAITTGINYLSNKAFDKKIMEQYDANPNSPANNFGMASIFGNTATGMYNYVRDLIGRTDPNGNPVEITEGEKTVLATAFLMNLAAMRGWMPGELKQIADNAAKKIDQRISTDAKDPYWIMMNNPDSKPDITINGRKIKWTNPEMLKYYQEQKSYHLNEIQKMPWTDKYKSTEATTRAKIDLQIKYGTDLQYEEQ